MSQSALPPLPHPVTLFVNWYFRSHYFASEAMNEASLAWLERVNREKRKLVQLRESIVKVEASGLMDQNKEADSSCIPLTDEFVLRQMWRRRCKAMREALHWICCQDWMDQRAYATYWHPLKEYLHVEDFHSPWFNLWLHWIQLHLQWTLRDTTARSQHSMLSTEYIDSLMQQLLRPVYHSLQYLHSPESSPHVQEARVILRSLFFLEDKELLDSLEKLSKMHLVSEVA